MACAIIAAAADPRRARRRCASRPAPSRERSVGDVSVRGALVADRRRIGSTAPNGIGPRPRRNAFFCPDADKARAFESKLDAIRKSGSSIGAVIEIVAENVPPGWGAPIYGKLDAELAAALMSINAVKGVEIGDGFAAAALSGEENADEMRIGNDGQPVFSQQSRRRHSWRHFHRAGDRRALRGQADLLDPVAAHDRSIARALKRRSSPRAVTIPASASAPCRSGEAMVACVLADQFLRHRAQIG